MKSLAALFLIIIISTLINAQQLSGNFTIGGNSPNFTGFGEAVAALDSFGVSGPVIFNVRSGVYMENNGNDRVIELLQNISGTSVSNTITFQPDAASGATRDDVILKRSSGDYELGRGFIIEIRSDYIRLQNLTVEYADTVGSAGEFSCIGLTSIPGGNYLDGVIISGCRIFSSGVIMRRAIAASAGGSGIEISNNEIEGVIWGISFNGNSLNYSDLVIKNNFITDLRFIFLTSVYGSAIEVINGTNAVIRGNTIAYAGTWGITGISVSGSSSGARIEGNLISEGRGWGYPCNTFDGIVLSNGATGVRVANNMVAGLYAGGARGIVVSGSNNQIIYNTVTHGYGSASGGCTPTALTINGSDNTIKNNILVQHKSHPFPGYVMQIIDTTGNVFDYNVLYQSENTRRLVYANGQVYDSLEAWQAAGHDLHSINKLPQFVDEFLDLHLAGCSVVDPELTGIGIAGFESDFDGDIRDGQTPFMGADEADGLLPEAFSQPQQTPVAGEALHFNAADLDGDGDIDIAMSNLETGSNDVSIFNNDGGGNFSGPNHLDFGNRPTVIRTVDLDDDGRVDLLASTDPGNNANTHLTIRWGSGGGNFSPAENFEYIKPVEDFLFLDLNNNGRLDVFQTHLGLVGSAPGDVSQFINEGGRSFLFANMGPYNAGQHPSAAVAANFNGDVYPDVAVLDYVNNTVAVLINRGATGGIWDGFENGILYAVSTGSSPLHANLAAGDIDGDGIADLLVGGEWGIGVDSLAFLPNNGDGTFAGTQKIPLDGFNKSETFTILDYENDGDNDIVTANNTHNLSLFINDGFGTFEKFLLCQNSDLGGEPLTILSANFNNDDLHDIAVLTINDDIMLALNEGWVATGTAGHVSSGPASGYQLRQNYPNPFNPETVIGYSLSVDQLTALKIYDITGREVRTLVNERSQPGNYTVRWDGRDEAGRQVASGIYLYRLQAGDFVQTRRMLLVR